MADIHKKLQDSIRVYMELPFLKSFTVYDNNGDRPTVVEHVMRGGRSRKTRRRKI
jgi:myosin-crossreactive antigen